MKGSVNKSPEDVIKSKIYICILDSTTLTNLLSCSVCMSKVAALFKVGNSKELPTIPDHLSDDGKDFVLKCLQRPPLLRPSAAQLLDHPFVKNIASSDRLIPNPGPITNSMRSLVCFCCIIYFNKLFGMVIY